MSNSCLKALLSEAKLKEHQNDEGDNNINKETELADLIENPNVSIPELRYLKDGYYRKLSNLSLLFRDNLSVEFHEKVGRHVIAKTEIR